MVKVELSKEVVAQVLAIAERAGQAILEVYHSEHSIEVATKTDDSPVTEADHTAHEIIEKGLQAAFPGIPVLSEESSAIAVRDRQQWEEFWLVDPLDGTKEFISHNGEFTVNIALIRHREPVLGVVTVPLKDEAYVAAEQVGAFKVQAQQWQAIKVRPLSSQNVVLVGSRRHGADALEKIMQQLALKFDQVETANMGSSLKFCLIAEGKADLYPRLAPTSEWDTAAAQAVLSAAGGKVFDIQWQPLRYNKADTLLNPYFIAVGDTSVDWPMLLQDAF